LKQVLERYADEMSGSCARVEEGIHPPMQFLALNEAEAWIFKRKRKRERSTRCRGVRESEREGETRALRPLALAVQGAAVVRRPGRTRLHCSVVEAWLDEELLGRMDDDTAALLDRAVKEDVAALLDWLADKLEWAAEGEAALLG
jgi:hypothetical protein